MLNLVTIVMGVFAAYFLTIQSLKIDLAAKAEGEVVGILDKKLASIEVILKEGVVSKEQFYSFSKEMEARLTRIEAYLAERSGEKIGN
ncbi:MAG: hypothetical protein DRN14_02680 [Thermoplasmata archaeon]|nr:MAG: hypothetical protein DRN14_02680 [Thermoplasmata archaeon]